MVIITPILESEHDEQEVIWNTTEVIDNFGKVIGKNRKKSYTSG